MAALFACFLDCSKAFDLVDHVQLFVILRNRGISESHCRLLAYIYSNQSAIVKWGVASSIPFKITNGVRQGGILSPLFFACYVDDVVRLLIRSGSGCYYGLNYVGILQYADDIVLLCPSIRGLNRMLHIVNEYFKSQHLCFNASKSCGVAFGSPAVFQFGVFLDGTRIPFLDKCKYLGVTLTSMLDDSYHARQIRRDFYARFNSLFVLFRKNRGVLLHLFKICCTSMYGIQCCDLRNRELLTIIEVSFNKALRRIFNLPYRTHRYILRQLADIDHTNVTIMSRMLGFTATCIVSPNRIVKNVASFAYTRNTTLLGGNLSYLCSQFGLDRSVVINGLSRTRLRALSRVPAAQFHCNVDQLWRVSFVRDLIAFEYWKHPDKDILSDIMSYICCE